jgi:hypothetical protein
MQALRASQPAQLNIFNENVTNSLYQAYIEGEPGNVGARVLWCAVATPTASRSQRVATCKKYV